MLNRKTLPFLSFWIIHQAVYLTKEISMEDYLHYAAKGGIHSFYKQNNPHKQNIKPKKAISKVFQLNKKEPP